MNPVTVGVKNGWVEIATSSPETALAVVGLDRLERLVHLTRESGALLRDLVRDTINDDLAHAGVLRDRELDPAEGNRRFWGYSASADDSYNSAAHALRMLFGRLELVDEDYVAREPGSAGWTLTTPVGCVQALLV